MCVLEDCVRSSNLEHCAGTLCSETKSLFAISNSIRKSLQRFLTNLSDSFGRRAAAANH